MYGVCVCVVCVCVCVCVRDIQDTTVCVLLWWYVFGSVGLVFLLVSQHLMSKIVLSKILKSMDHIRYQVSIDTLIP